MATETITLAVILKAFVRRDTPRRWIATCPLVGVASQGRSAEDAKRCLEEAVELWFESCIERGVLDQALREANFRPFQTHPIVPAGDPVKPHQSGRRPPKNVLGEGFEIRLTIPAYEAVTLLSASA